MKRLPPGVSATPAGTFIARYRDADGKQHSRTFASAKVAAAWKADREADVRRGDHVDPHAGRIRLDRWWDEWSAARAVERTTAHSDETRWRTHLKPQFGSTSLAGITRIKVQAWVRDLNEKMAPASTHKCVRLLSAMMRDAVREGHVRINPCADLDLPVLPPGRERSFTNDEIDRILAAMTRDRDRLIMLALVDTGLRWSELVGLRLAYRRDGSMVGLDLMRRWIVVADTTVEVGGKLVEKPYPKGKQRRTVPVTPRLYDAWTAYLATRQVGPGDRAIVGEHGAALRKTWGGRRWAEALRVAGVEHAPVHTLRHTYGSRLVDAGRSLTEVQKLLGHAAVTTTSRYLHAAEDDFDGVLTALTRPALRSSSIQ